MDKIPVRKITTQNENVSFGKFKIRNLQTLLNGEDLFQGLHRHDFYFILAIQKGTGTHQIDFNSYPVNDYSIFILRPGQVHEIELKKNCDGFLVEFDTSFYNPIDHIVHERFIRSGNKNFCEVEFDRFQKLYTMLSNMFNEFTSKEDGYKEVIKANLDIFFLEFIRQSRNNNKDSNSYLQGRFETFLKYLSENITTHKQVSEYASLLNLSSYQLNAITKKTVNKTASQIINEHILLEAKRYLLASNNQVKDIANHLGYDDISYFIRFFKKHSGYSPEAFRKNFK